MNEEKIPHIGKILRERVDESGLSKTNIARQMNAQLATLYTSFNSPNVSLRTLWKVSKIINYNILYELSEKLSVDFETKREAELKKELEMLRKEYELLKLKTDMLEKIVMK